MQRRHAKEDEEDPSMASAIRAKEMSASGFNYEMGSDIGELQRLERRDRIKDHILKNK